jgi:hypothetical protein
LGNWVIGVFDEKPNYPIIPINLTQLIDNWVFIYCSQEIGSKKTSEGKTLWKMNLQRLWNVFSLQQQRYFDIFESSDFSVPSNPDVLKLLLIALSVPLLMFNRCHLKMKSINLV